MSWLWTGLLWVWSADPLLVSLIALAWLLGALAVVSVSPAWMGLLHPIRGAEPRFRFRAPRPAPPVEVEVASGPVAEVIDIEKRRTAA